MGTEGTDPRATVGTTVDPRGRLDAAGFGRRAFLAASGGLTLLAFASPLRLAAMAATAPGPGQPGRFLTAHELDTLRAVSARLLPGPPEDPDPGALEAGVAEAIDLLLGAFTVSPAFIHAGGPYSDRAGSTHDDFADFVALDPLAELGWRIRLEGSQGKPAREFAGPVRGLQELYRQDLAHLDDRARSLSGRPFADLPAPAQELILRDQSDATVQELVGAALANALEAMYGAPEYGGNRGLSGWTPLRWPGDVQPRGYTVGEVSGPDPSAARTATSPSDALGAIGSREVGAWLASARGRAAPTGAWWRARRGVPHG